MPWPQPPAAGVFCATPYHDAMRHIAAQVRASVLHASMPSNGRPAPPGVHALTTLRGPAGDSAAPFDRFNLGLCNGDDPDVAQGNRVMLEKGLGLPSPPHWLRQVHGTTVVRFDSPRSIHGEGEPAPETLEEQAIEADAAVTSTPGTVLAILTADCLPVVFAANDGSEIAIAHAGWRGLAAGVLEATVAAMHASPSQVLAWLGPAAGPQAYEIGEDVRDVFLSRDPHAGAAFTATRPGHWTIDLCALAQQRLATVGVSSVHGGGPCTISDPGRFFSHRRDTRSGRMATLVWMECLG